MPELPEVETIRRQLEKLIVGRTISSIEVLNPGSFRADADSLIGKTVAAVGRKGKVLIITSSRGRAQRGRGDLDGYGPDNLYIHLKMSGRLEFRAKGQGLKAKGETPKHLRVSFNFDNGDRLLFHDQRKFGWITDDPTVLPRGTDVLDPQLTSEILAEILSSSSRPIKQILLDQSKIAGIGNIYASEILWEAGISPYKSLRATAGSVVISSGLPRRPRPTVGAPRNDKLSIKLLSAIRLVLNEAIDSGGSTMDDKLYRHVSGQTGDYWSRRRIYGRAGQPCRRPACHLPAGRQEKSGSVIQKTVIGHRSTYFCPSCQSS